MVGIQYYFKAAPPLNNDTQGVVNVGPPVNTHWQANIRPLAKMSLVQHDLPTLYQRNHCPWAKVGPTYACYLGVIKKMHDKYCKCKRVWWMNSLLYKNKYIFIFICVLLCKGNLSMKQWCARPCHNNSQQVGPSVLDSYWWNRICMSTNQVARSSTVPNKISGSEELICFGWVDQFLWLNEKYRRLFYSKYVFKCSERWADVEFLRGETSSFNSNPFSPPKKRRVLLLRFYYSRASRLDTCAHFAASVINPYYNRNVLATRL